MKNKLKYYLFLSPVIFFIILIFAYPLLKTFQYSFFDVSYSEGNGQLVWLDNYINVFKDPEFWIRVKVSSLWTLLNVTIQLIIPLLFAFILLQTNWLNNIARSLMLMSWIVPVVAIGVSFRLFLLPGLGYANTFLSLVGLPQIDFLGNKFWAIITLALINSWKFIPFGSLITLAALQLIPLENYEAAQIDGAGGWQQFIYVTLPLLSERIWFLPFLSIVWNFNTFELIWLTTRGGPGMTTETLPMGIYRSAFTTFRFGEAAAVSSLSIIALAMVGLLFFKYLVPEKDEQDHGGI